METASEILNAVITDMLTATSPVGATPAALLEARARTVDDMRLISTLCALVEEAGRQRA